jgi:tRNA threonylcarbamoyl adenosine modification protein YeaZ
MWTLALETTTANGSVALLHDETVTAVAPLEPGHYATSVFALTRQMLEAARLELRQIQLFAAAQGPGSFTGIRVGLATVKGFTEALGAPAVGVSTLRAVAAARPGARLAALDAGRGDIYYGLFPEAEEGIEEMERFRDRLAALPPGAAATPDPRLQAALSGVGLVPPLLAPAVGLLGLADWRAGVAADALSLDACYLGRRWGP